MKKEKVSLKKRLLAAFCAFAICGGGFLASCSDSSDDNDSTDDNQEKNQPESSVVTLKSGSTTVYSGTDINAAWAAIGSSGDYVLTLEKGTYSVTEGTQLSYNGAANIKISGNTTTEYGADVIISGNPKTASQKSRELVYLPAGSTGNLTLENVRIVNEYGTTTGDAQAEVLATDGSGNLAAYNCSFISGQDTLRTVAKAWFYKCYIEGDVDFLWMETTGTVALYEECVLHAISSRTTKAYFAAPRAALTSKVGKGLVVYNSKLEADSGLEKLYLARNPWASSALSSYYNNVAFVGTTGDVTLTDLWASDSNGTTDKQYIGFKADSNFTASSTTYGAVLSDSVKTAEYAGRRNILNRLYNVTSAKYQEDTESAWDIDSVISDNGWTVTADTSKSLLDGETAVESKTYDFVNTISTYTDLVTNGTVNDNDVDKTTGVRKSHVVLNADATLSFPVTGNCIVTVTGYYKGEGSIQAGSQGKALFDFNNGSTSKMIEKSYVVYSGACDVTITASAETYITKISVEYDASLTFNPVTAITLSTADDATEVASKKTLQFSATLSPDSPTNDDIVWSITRGDSVASIDQNGLLTAGSADADTIVTVRATSCDENAAYGEKTVTVLKANDNAGELDWVKDWTTTTTVSTAAVADYSNGLATGGDVSAYYSTETEAISTFTVATQRTQTGLAYAPASAWTFAADAVMMTYKFPVTAGSSAITLTNFAYNWGCGATNNINGQIKVLDSNGTALYTGSKLKSGSTEGHTSEGIVASDALNITLAANTTATIVVEITASSAITNKTNAFVLADAVLDFEAQ